MALTISNLSDSVNIFEADFKTYETYEYTLSGDFTVQIEEFFPGFSTWNVITPEPDSSFYVPSMVHAATGSRHRLRFTFTPTTGGISTYEFNIEARK